MRTTTSRLHSLKRDRRGLSNIIVVVLSLVIIVAIASNVVLWGYQMTQLDWERTQEKIAVTNVVNAVRSSWFVTQNEYIVNVGTHISGSYMDTQTVDSSFESFRESNPPRVLNINSTFLIDLATNPLAFIRGIEIQLRYRVDDINERWFLKTYNWTSRTYSNAGFNTTTGHAPSFGWNYYGVSVASNWQHYVNGNGNVLVQIHDQGSDTTRTAFDIDFLAIRVAINGALFTFQNKGSRTTHLVSVWINNSTLHTRYSVDVFVNSGETLYYVLPNTTLPNGQYLVKVVTERGNSAVYTGG